VGVNVLYVDGTGSPCDVWHGSPKAAGTCRATATLHYTHVATGVQTDTPDTPSTDDQGPYA